jgi:MinD-like ATPase involved in chromosome partitioning or flagellar assembly
VTTNNDTPQTFGPAGHDADGRSDDYRSPRPDDQAHPAVNGWAGWGEPAEPAAAAGQGYPQPAFYPHDLEYPPSPEHAPDAGFARDAGFAPDAGYPRRLGYPQDPGYEPEAERAAELGYLPDLGFPPDASAVPQMEPLPGFDAPDAPGPASPHPPQDTSSGWDLDSQRAGTQARAGYREDTLAPPPAAQPEGTRETSDSLTTESLLHGKRAAPGSGWRRSVYRATGGLLRFGESAAEMRHRDLINRVRTPVAGGHHRVAVLSLKGGVGKTTTAVGLGATLATLRGDRVIAVDANPDRGTLSDKVRLETSATIRDLLNERDQVRRYADVRAFTSQAPSRLEVLASDRDPAVSVAFGAEDYCDTARVLEHFYSICITDCGTGLLHSAMSGVLRLADQIVLVSSPSVDGARSASATLDWLEVHHCGDLVRNGVVVLSAIRPKSKSTVDLDRLEHHFAARCRAVTRIPYDPHLEEGAEVELELLGSDTADAYLVLAALVGDGLAWPRRLTSRSALP